MPNELYDLRKTKHFIVDHLIVDEYLPALGGKAFQLYSIYCRIASTHRNVFPSFRTLRKNTGFGFNQIIKCNQLLEELGLIRIVRSNSSAGDRDNNKYFLLDPKPLSKEIKAKYYPADWEPIIKHEYQGAIKLIAPMDDASPSEGDTEMVAPVLSSRKHRATDSVAQVIPKRKHIKNTTVVVNNNKTTTNTTEASIEGLADYLEKYTSIPVVDSLPGMNVILETAMNKKDSLKDAIEYIQFKISQFAGDLPNKKNPMGFLHDAVRNDYVNNQQAKLKKYHEDQERQEEAMNTLEEERKKAWNEMTAIERAKHYRDAVKYILRKNTRKQPTEENIQTAIEELAQNGNWNSVDIRFPSPNFHSQGD